MANRRQQARPIQATESSSRECPCCGGGGRLEVCPPLVWIYEDDTERLLWAGDPEIVRGIGSWVWLHAAYGASLPPKTARSRTYPFVEQRQVLRLRHILVGLESTAKQRHRIEIIVGALSDG